uniref:integrase core domain-containing protein n=1 Tax=Thiolapillus sp. TaxID=2017437 RepID=UPI0035A81F63
MTAHHSTVMVLCARKNGEKQKEARTSLDIYFTFYNTERRHQRLDRRTPDNVY